MEKKEIVITTANPAPLGLLGFGLTTVLLNLHNIGLFGVNAMIIGMGLFIGGSAQIIAGVQEFKKNNTFGSTAFTAYGFFWISLCAIWLLPRMSFGEAFAVDKISLGWYLLVWGIFSNLLFIGTLRMNLAMQILFGSLVLLFYLLAIRDFTNNNLIGTMAGFIGIFCGSTAVYISAAQILNEIYQREIFPLGKK